MVILKKISRWFLGLLFVAAGANHFWHPDFYVTIMPPYLPWHRELVLISGACEILLGALLFVPRWTRIAAVGLAALLIAMFPANLHMAMNPADSPNIPVWALWLRLPLQGVLIAWAYWYTRQDINSANSPST